MDFVATVLADPQKAPLTEALADSIAHALSMQGVALGKREWLKEGEALDLYIPSPFQGEGQGGGYSILKDNPLLNPPPKRGRNFLENLGSIVQDAIRGYPFDAVAQPVAHRKKKLLIADMESTIITCECLDELAELAGIKDRVAAITRRAMNGEIDFEAALKERVMLLKGMTESALQKVMDEKVRLMPGARELVTAMKKNGAHTMLVSGGFDFFADKVKDMLGFDEARSNRLEMAYPLPRRGRVGVGAGLGDEKDFSEPACPPPDLPPLGGGVLTGNVILPILGKEAKLQALRDACARLNISPEEVLAVGDGANDLPMLLEAGLGVAYHAKPAVQAQAKAKINHGDLTALLYAQGFTSFPHSSAG